MYICRTLCEQMCINIELLSSMQKKLHLFTEEAKTRAKKFGDERYARPGTLNLDQISLIVRIL